MVSGVCKISIDVPGLTTGPKDVGGKMKDMSLLPLVTLGFSTLVSIECSICGLKGMII